MKTAFSLAIVAGLVISAASASAADLSANAANPAEPGNARSEAGVEAPVKPARRAKTGSASPTERAAPTTAEKDVWSVPLFQNAKPLHAPR